MQPEGSEMQGRENSDEANDEECKIAMAVRVKKSK